jgi:beta-mannosidase
MFDSAAAIFWMYNDCWPATRSWTIVDYYGRRTPAFWHVRRMFRPLIIALVVEDDRVSVFGVNDGPDWTGELRYGLFALAGGEHCAATQAVTLPGNQSALLAEFPSSEWRSRGELTYGAFAILSQDGREVARDRLFLPLYKDLALPKAVINVRRAGGRAIFESNVFAWQVCLDLTGELPLPDNFFDVLPGIPTVLDWPAELGAPCVVRIGNN